MQTYTKAELYKVMQMECFDISVVWLKYVLLAGLNLFLFEGIYKELL